MRFNLSSKGRLACAIIIGLAVAGCGSSDSPTDGGDGPPGTVSVRDDFFQPSSTSVHPGEVVTWQWQGQAAHNVTWVSADLPNSVTQVSGSHQVEFPHFSGQVRTAEP